MKAVRNAPPTVEVVEVDEPEGDGQLVRVATTSICASDLMYLRYGSTQIAGHEFAGTLEDGTAVAVEAIFGCGSCPECEQGNYNMCHLGPTALGMLQPGGMSEWYRAPSHALHPLPEGLRLSDASLVEPASVGRHTCHVGGVGSDTRFAVVGAGAIGLLAAASAQQMGAAEVAVEALLPHQHEARERMEATVPTGDYDVVVEASGDPSGLQRAVELARRGGTVVLLGTYDPDTSWPFGAAFSKEVGLKFSLGYCGHDGRREFEESADMLASRPDLSDMLITHRYGIDDAAEAFRVAQDQTLGVFRVVIEP